MSDGAMSGARGRTIPARPVVGVLHPGTMGAALGSALKARAGAVIWAAADRSDATSKRAELADLQAVPDVGELARRSDVVVSICPPDQALAVARQVAAALNGTGRDPLYVDANAVSPATVAEIAALLGTDRVVDAAVIGPPAWESGHTVLWLAGTHATAVADLFADTPFGTGVLDAGLGAASALKACYAVQSKAVPAAWFALLEAAQRYGVADALHAELDRTGAAPPLDRDRVADRAWRWVGEMEQAAATLAAVGLPDGFSTAAAQMYRRLTP